MASVELRHVTKRFGRDDVIRDVELEIPDGRLTVFVGPSGCGKSTLLRLIAGLEDVSSGEIRIGGRPVNDVPPAKRGVAMVFQNYALYPHMDVFQNMAFGLKLARKDRGAIEHKVRQAARKLRIEALLEAKPRELSGGQRQRVAIGRAIVREPEVFLFDEPLSNLDAALRVRMRLELTRLQRELGATMVYVTHDQTEAMTLGDAIVVLNQGRVEQTGTPLELYRHPANRFVAGFIGSPEVNLLDIEVDKDGGALRLSDGQRMPVPDLPAGGPATMGVRPEHIRLGQGPLTGRVALVERLGGESYLHLELADGTPITARVPGDSEFHAGEPLSMAFPSEALHFFDAGGKRLNR